MIARLRSSVRFGGRPAGILLIAAGMLAGSVLTAPGVGLAAVTTAVVQTRAVSCGMSAFRPTISDTSYTIGGAQVLYRSGPGGSPLFRCDPGLPHNAVVTKLQVTVADYTDQGQMGACTLRRYNLEAATAGSAEEMASVPATGIAATPGRVRLTDSSIALATVKNGKFAYAVQCELSSHPNAGLFGASVTYTISSADG